MRAKNRGTLLAALALALTGVCHAVPNVRLQHEIETAISRRLAHDTAGRIYLLRIGPAGSGISLQLGPAEARKLADFGSPVDLLRQLEPSGSVSSAGIVIDNQDCLHLAWSTTEGRTAYAMLDLRKGIPNPGSRWLNPESGQPGKLIVAAANSRLGDIVVGPKGKAWLTWTESKPSRQSTLFLGAVLEAGGWHAHRLAEGHGYFPASLAADGKGDFHLGWNDIYGESWILSGSAAALGATSRTRPVRLPRGGFRPEVIEASGALLVVRENESSDLEYMRVGEGEPRPQSFGRSREDRRFANDTLHSPQLRLDAHGVPWLFFIDSARQNVFYARWLGAGWSPIGNAGRLTWNSARFEDNHVAIDRIAVGELVGPSGMAFGLLIENDSLSPMAGFQRIEVPRPVADAGRKILFFDLMEVGVCEGLGVTLNPPQKRGQVMGPGLPGDFDAEQAASFVRVLKENGKYRMWYSGYQAVNSDRWWEGYRVGYAESSDGTHFERVNLGLMPFNGKADTNMIPDIPYVPMVCLDPSDSTPGQRYKLLKFPLSAMEADEARAGRINPWTDSRAGHLFVSDNGVNWRPLPATIEFPGGKPFSFVPQSLFFDAREQDPQKRYKAYGFSSLNRARRSGSYAFSPDARHWTASADNPVLDPFAVTTPPVRGGKVQQVHDTVVWREGDYYLALYQYQHGGEPAPDLDLYFAISRDGEHFLFLKPDQAFIPKGAQGEWDAEELNPSIPLVDDTEIKVYYGGNDGKKAFGGLATLRLDGYTDLELVEGRDRGTFSTVPIEAGTALRLVANVECGPGYLEAEIIDPTSGRPAEGYTREESERIAGDSVAHPIVWKQRRDLSGIPRNFQLRIYFHGGGGYPRLYSLRFE